MDDFPRTGMTLLELAKRTGLSPDQLSKLCRQGHILGARQHPLSKRWVIYPPGTLIHPAGTD